MRRFLCWTQICVMFVLASFSLNIASAQENIPLPELGVISFENAERLEEVAVLDISTSIYQQLEWSSDSRMMAVTDSCGLTFYNFVNDEITSRLLREAGDYVLEAAFSPDNSILAVTAWNWDAQESHLQFWDVEMGTMLREFEFGYVSLSDILFSPDGTKLIAIHGGYDSASVVFFDVTTGEEISQMSYRWAVKNMMLSPDDSGLIYGVENIVYDSSYNYLYSIMSWAFDDPYTGGPIDLGVQLGGFGDIDSPFDGTYFIVLLSPDGSLLAARPYEGVDTLWDVESGEQLATLPENLHFNSFLLDGTLVVSDSRDDTVRLWRPDETETPLVFDNENVQWQQTYLSPDGKLLAVSTSLDVIRLYGVPTQ